MKEVIVVGGSVAGLCSALALARQGHRVMIIERESVPLPSSPVEAFHTWERRGAPQVWHSHAFLARLHQLLDERAPDVLDALREAGAEELRFGEHLPEGMAERYVREPGDEKLVLLACRRVTFEWVLRRAVAAEPGVEWREGVAVDGLAAETDEASGVPRVVGVRVRTHDGVDTVWRADAVVDASGRRSPLHHWLEPLGGPPLDEESEDCGIFYSSRFYRLRPGTTSPLRDGPVGMDLGYLKYAIFPGDSGIFSVTLAASKEDADLRAVVHEKPFAAAAMALPPVREWIAPERAEPITRVWTMASLRNRRRRLVRAGRPVVLGVHPVGDAAVCTNPMYGRGCSLAAVHAWLLADAFTAHPDDPAACSLAFDAATRREIDPWYESARMQDADSRTVMARERRGERDACDGRDPSPNKPVDPKAFLRSVLTEGLFPAMRTDPVVLRAVLRSFNLLDPPLAIVSKPDVMSRIIAVWRARDAHMPEEDVGPRRGEMLRILQQARA